MPLTLPDSEYVPYHVQTLGDEIRAVIERHRRENPSITELDIATALKMTAPRRTSWTSVLSNANKVVFLVATIVGIAIAITSMTTMYSIYETLHGQGVVQNSFFERFGD